MVIIFICCWICVLLCSLRFLHLCSWERLICITLSGNCFLKFVAVLSPCEDFPFVFCFVTVLWMWNYLFVEFLVALTGWTYLGLELFCRKFLITDLIYLILMNLISFYFGKLCFFHNFISLFKIWIWAWLIYFLNINKRIYR